MPRRKAGQRVVAPRRKYAVRRCARGPTLGVRRKPLAPVGVKVHIRSLLIETWSIRGRMQGQAYTFEAVQLPSC